MVQRKRKFSFFMRLVDDILSSTSVQRCNECNTEPMKHTEQI